MIHPAAFVDERAQIGVGVEVEPGAVIGPNVRIGDRCQIGSHALVTGWTTLGRECRLFHGAVVGTAPQDLKYTGERSQVEIGERTTIREYATVHLAAEPGATTRLGSDGLIMAYAHVAHDCRIGDHVVIANATQLAGYVTVEDWAIIGGLSAVHQFVRIGCHAIIGGGSRIPQDVAPYAKVAGSPLRNVGINAIGLDRRGFAPETVEAIGRAYRILFRSRLTVVDAVARMRDELGHVPEVERMARFAETSQRGLSR